MDKVKKLCLMCVLILGVSANLTAGSLKYAGINKNSKVMGSPKDTTTVPKPLNKSGSENQKAWIEGTNPVGDITSVSAGTGLTGGGVEGDINLSFDQSWGDGRYIQAGESAGGDLSGTYPNPSVIRLRGFPVSSTTPSTGQVLMWNGSHWAPGNVSGGDNDWTIVGNNIYRTSGYVGIGTSSPSHKLEVYSSIPGIDAIHAKTTVSNQSAVYGEATGSGAAGVSGQTFHEDAVGVAAWAGVDGATALKAVGANGKAIYASGTGNYPTITIDNWGADGMGMSVLMHPNNNSAMGIYVATSYGYGIGVYKTSSDGSDALWIQTPSSSYEYGIYCVGKAYFSGGTKAGVKTEKGWRTVNMIESPDGDFYISGQGQLKDGRAVISFEEISGGDKIFEEAVSEKVPVKVIVTPVGSWSGLYVIDASPKGFTVLSATGDPNAKFNWIAIGRKKGEEERDKSFDTRLESMRKIIKAKAEVLK